MISKASTSPSLDPARGLDDSHERLVLGLGRRERAEVVPTGEERGLRLQARDVERPRHATSSGRARTATDARARQIR